MRRGLLLLAAAALALPCGVALGKTDDKAKEPPAPHPRYARSLADAMAEAKERGCVVFATVHEDG